MTAKITALFLSISMALMTVMGLSFDREDYVMAEIYHSRYEADSENQNHEKLEELFSKVRETIPETKIIESKKPFADDSRIEAISFYGEMSGGKPAEVFAYIGFPENASASEPVPAMVLVHGGGSHACADWVRYWVERGYAAFSFDGFGQKPKDGEYSDSSENWVLNPDSHPTIDNFASASKPVENQWFYYFVSDAILAGNILRADERVDSGKIGITGISWGGVCTSVVICYDSRFAFAIPVYGCGFLYESKSIFGPIVSPDKVRNVWDSAPLLGKVNLPVLFVACDDDSFFSADILTASAAAVLNGSAVLVPGLHHGMEEGMTEPEIFRFADEQTGLSRGNITIDEVGIKGNRALLSFSVPDDVKKIKCRVYYKTTDLEYDENYILKEDWKSHRGITLGGKANLKIPDNAEIVFFSVSGRDAQGNTVYASTGVYDAEYLKIVNGY